MTSQYGAKRCVLDKQGYNARTRIYTPMRLGTHMHARTRAHAHKYVILIALPRQQRFADALHCYVIHTLPVLLTLICWDCGFESRRGQGCLFFVL